MFGDLRLKLRTFLFFPKVVDTSARKVYMHAYDELLDRGTASKKINNN